MTVGEGIAFAAFMWAIVQLSYLLHHRSKSVTTDEVKEQLDRITKHLNDCFGPFNG